MVNNKGWSFCIVTAPGNDAILQKSIKKIQDEFKECTNYEIIVIGNVLIPNSELKKNLKIIPFKEDVFSIKLSNIKRVIKELSLKRFFFRSGAICHKKNIAAKNAKYDKLCIMHDYVGLESGWKKSFEKFGENWLVSTNIILNIDGKRHRDWILWDHPLVDGPGMLPYDIESKYMYLSGGYFCVKRDFFLNNLLDESLFWGEGEDVEWSLRVREKTKFKMNDKSVVVYLKDKTGCPHCPEWEVNTKKINLLVEGGNFYD